MKIAKKKSPFSRGRVFLRTIFEEIKPFRENSQVAMFGSLFRPFKVLFHHDKLSCDLKVFRNNRQKITHAVRIQSHKNKM